MVTANCHVFERNPDAGDHIGFGGVARRSHTPSNLVIEAMGSPKADDSEVDNPMRENSSAETMIFLWRWRVRSEHLALGITRTRPSGWHYATSATRHRQGGALFECLRSPYCLPLALTISWGLHDAMSCWNARKRKPSRCASCLSTTCRFESLCDDGVFVLRRPL